MKTLCVLVVVVVAVAASPDCSSYCDKLYSGWNLERRSDCDCDAPQKELQDGLKYEHDLKSILLPGYLPSEIRHNKIKRSSRTDVVTDGAIPVERAHNSSTTSKSSDDVFNNSQIRETNLSDCIDLLISISIRKNKKKNFASLGLNGLEKSNNLNDLEINTEIKNKCDQASAIIKQSVEEIKEHQKNIGKKKNQNVEVAPKLDIRSGFELTDEKTPATSTNDDNNNTVKSTHYDKFYTNTVTTNDNTTILDPAVNDFNLSSRLKDNNQQETNKNYNLKNLNSVEVIMKDDDNTTNSIVNTTSTKIKNIQTTTGNMSSLPYNLKNIEKNNLNYELTSKESQSPLILSERVRNKSMLMADYSDNVKEGTSIPNQYTTKRNKTDIIKTINQNENDTSLRDRYKENEVPIVSIITREYPNDTISSILNGTETLTYSKFEEEAIINNNNTENTSDSRLISTESELAIRSRSDDTPPSTSEEQSSEIMSPTINGRLFFEYKQEHIPGQFVQTQDGRLRLSLDINTICDELSQKGKQNSLLISNLCQYLNKRNQSMGYGMQ